MRCQVKNTEATWETTGDIIRVANFRGSVEDGARVLNYSS